MDPLTGIHEPTVTIPWWMDCRDLPKDFMSILEFRQVAGPIQPADTTWAKEAIKSIKGSK